mmetsp:Transcript_78575/g.222154  ORF Transcript_78575/g.222154 Transcript_78575/m.222154 type:complete len:423 (+) Transcript_78575:1-1269(+)
MASLVWLGALLGVFASMTGTAGKQLLRFSQLQSQKGTKSGKFMSMMALSSGLFLNVLIGPVIDMASYAFAPQSIIAPLGGLDVVWNTITAPCTLGETLTPSLVVGCALIAGGATATSLFGSHEEGTVTLDSLKDTLFRWAVLIYLSVLFVWLAFNVIVLMPRSAAPKGQPFASGDKLRGLSLGMTAGSIAGNMFCVKAFVEVVQTWIQDGAHEVWADWLPYVLLLGAILFATTNLYFLTKAMREYEALFMGAVFEGSLITAACVSGVVVFKELEGLEAWQIAVYWSAVLSMVFGIGLVAWGGMSSEEPDATAAKEQPEIKRVNSDKSTKSTQSTASLPPVPTETGVPDPPKGNSVFSFNSSNRSASKRSNNPECPFREVPVAFKEMGQAYTLATTKSNKSSPVVTMEVSGSPAAAKASCELC